MRTGDQVVQSLPWRWRAQGMIFVIGGVGLGGCIPVDLALVGEFTPAKVRGRVLAAMDGFWPLGATLCGLTAAFLSHLGSWRLLMLTMVLPALMLFWIRRGVPESPMFL